MGVDRTVVILPAFAAAIKLPKDSFGARDAVCGHQAYPLFELYK
jgi:hypothetical protein